MDIKESEQALREYEEDEIYVKLELAEMILGVLVGEVVGLLK